MIQIEFPVDALTALSRKTREAMLTERPELLSRLGDRLKELVIDSYHQRAEGGQAVGITWEPLSERYLKRKRRRGLSPKIGIATGALLDSIEVEETGEGLTLSFAAEYAAEFNLFRPLLPEMLPEEWQESLEAVALEWADDILVEHFEEDVPF